VFRRDAIEKWSQAVHTGGQGFLHLDSMRRIELVVDCKGLGCDGVDKRWSLAVTSEVGDQGSRGANSARIVVAGGLGRRRAAAGSRRGSGRSGLDALAAAPAIWTPREVGDEAAAAAMGRDGAGG
jgi:hypothetical protein